MKNVVFALFGLLAAGPALAQTAPEVRPVASFHALEVSSGIELVLTAGEPQRVEVSADTPENLARLKTSVSPDGVLQVRFEQDKSERYRNRRDHKLRAYVTAARLTALKASSGASVEVKGPYATDELQLDLSSGATLKGDFTAAAVQARLSSGSTATVGGSAQRLDVSASSGSVFGGNKLQAAVCEASASSGGNIATAVEKTLTAEASSGGGISYSGSPQVTKRTSSGGSVSAR